MLMALRVPFRMALRIIARVRPSIWATVATDRTRNLNTALWYCYLNHTARERGLQGVGGLEAFLGRAVPGGLLGMWSKTSPPCRAPEARIPKRARSDSRCWSVWSGQGTGTWGLSVRVPGVRVTPVTGWPRG
jgi:hypothetical protein